MLQTLWYMTSEILKHEDNSNTCFQSTMYCTHKYKPESLFYTTMVAFDLF